MKFFGRSGHAIKAAGIGAALLFSVTASQAQSSGPFAGFDGAWTGTGTVSLNVDQIARPGAMVSGKVTFSDGKGAEWYFDQSGRLGLVPQEQGYRPSAADLQQFQAALDSELSKLGF